jgi:transcriptional regulator with XRE-family HTH domain
VNLGKDVDEMESKSTSRKKDWEKIIGTRIRELRQTRGWSVDFLAERVFLAPRILELIEDGKWNIDQFFVERIASVFHIGSDDIIVRPLDQRSEQWQQLYQSVQKIIEEPEIQRFFSQNTTLKTVAENLHKRHLSNLLDIFDIILHQRGK